jgi:hypothetical protein
MRLGTVFFSPKRSQDREVIAEQKLSHLVRSKLKTRRMAFVVDEVKACAF